MASPRVGPAVLAWRDGLLPKYDTDHPNFFPHLRLAIEVAEVAALEKRVHVELAKSSARLSSPWLAKTSTEANLNLLDSAGDLAVSLATPWYEPPSKDQATRNAAKSYIDRFGDPKDPATIARNEQVKAMLRTRLANAGRPQAPVGPDPSVPRRLTGRR